MSQATNPTDAKPMTGVQRDILLSVVIAADDGPPIGAEVCTAAEDVRGVGVDKTVLYGALDRLTDRGLVDKRPHPTSGRSNVYEVTDDGLAALSDRLETMQEALS